MISIRVAMAKASTARRQPTNLHTKARTATKTRTAKRIASCRRPAALTAARTRTGSGLTSIKVPIAHQKISIPAATAAQSTKAKTKTGIARKIRTGTAAVTTRAAPAGRNTKAGIRTASARTRTRAPARRTRTSRRRLATTRTRPK